MFFLQICTIFLWKILNFLISCQTSQMSRPIFVLFMFFAGARSVEVERALSAGFKTKTRKFCQKSEKDVKSV